MSQTIIIIGSVQSGKTYLMNHLTRSYFEPFRTDRPYKPTIGIDIVGKNTVHNINYVYYDSSGSDRFLDITQPYMKACDVVIIVFDLSSYDVQNLNQWYESAKCREKPTLIVGTKHDLIREDNHDLLMNAVRFAQERECPFYSTSSVSGMGITELRNALQNVVSEEIIFRKTLEKKRRIVHKIKQTKKNRFRKKKVLRMFCCIGKGYTTIDDVSESDKFSSDENEKGIVV